MTSGLENPLSYFLVGLVAWLIAADGVNGSAAGGSRAAPTVIGAGNLNGLNGASRRRRWLFIVLALLVLNRPDYAALFLPLAGWLAAAAFKAHGPRGLLKDVWPGALLLFAWFAFALIYFGSLLPNTFYAKMAADVPRMETSIWGVNYFRATAHRDPVTLLIIAVGVGASFLSRRPALIALAAGQSLYLAFILRAGGDFMQGRFFAVPVCLAVGQMIFATACCRLTATGRGSKPNPLSRRGWQTAPARGSAPMP